MRGKEERRKKASAGRDEGDGVAVEIENRTQLKVGLKEKTKQYETNGHSKASHFK